MADFTLSVAVTSSRAAVSVLRAADSATRGAPREILLEDISDRGLVQLSGRGKVFHSFELPGDPNTCFECASTIAAWTGPQRWLLIGSPQDADRWAATPVPDGAVVDVSHSRSIVRISGPRWRELLAHGCPLDIETTFPHGQWRCAQSLFSEVPVLLLVPPDGSWIEVYSPLSYRRFLWEMLAASLPEDSQSCGRSERLR